MQRSKRNKKEEKQVQSLLMKPTAAALLCLAGAVCLPSVQAATDIIVGTQGGMGGKWPCWR